MPSFIRNVINLLHGILITDGTSVGLFNIGTHQKKFWIFGTLLSLKNHKSNNGEGSVLEKYWGDYFAVVSGGEENWRVSRLSKEQEGEKLEMMENDTLQRFLLRKKYFFF